MFTLHPPLRSAPPRILLGTVASFLLLLAWDASGLDLTLAHWFGAASGFALESHWLWRGVLHDDIRLWPWVMELGLLMAIFMPVGSFRQLPMARRAQLALTTLAALLTVSTIKLYSHTSCPWTCKRLAAWRLMSRTGPWACAMAARAGVFRPAMRRQGFRSSAVFLPSGMFCPRRLGAGLPVPCWPGWCLAWRNKFAAHIT